MTYEDAITGRDRHATERLVRALRGEDGRCPSEHTYDDHWTEDTYGVEHRVVCGCECEVCREF